MEIAHFTCIWFKGLDVPLEDIKVLLSENISYKDREDRVFASLNRI